MFPSKLAQLCSPAAHSGNYYTQTFLLDATGYNWKKMDYNLKISREKYKYYFTDKERLVKKKATILKDLGMPGDGL